MKSADFVDTHCHLRHSPMCEDIDGTLARALQAGVTRVIEINMELAEPLQQEGVFFACGIHPNEASRWKNDQVEERFRQLISHTKCVAVGEIGLDFYRDYETPAAQTGAFLEQLNIAAECRKPVVIHCREAYDDTLSILAEWVRRLPGVHLHCFGGTPQHLDKALDLGCFIGFDGPVTYKNAENVRELARRAPLNRILLETDSPYMAPHPHRGRPNDPSYIPLIGEGIAVVKGISVEDVARQTTVNAQMLFGL